ncbi:uncharacterized protein [Coffea arabica]|uniref:Uncharacterized protein n=1 Tax=Coffea arabica TaxID=13443 RepID=A0ABM4WME6_COFAR
MEEDGGEEGDQEQGRRMSQKKTKLRELKAIPLKPPHYFEGKPWTWCNQWEGEGEVKERLDRCLASVKWYQTFDRACCNHIENEASDHSMLIMDLNPNQKKNGFTNMEKEKQHEFREKDSGNKGEDSGVKGQQYRGKKDQLVELKLQLSKAYQEEELYWSQKARTRWLQEGDKNTVFFHTSAMNARKQRQITYLQKENGQWCTNEQEVMEEICGYYKQLLTSGEADQIEETLRGVPNTISR